LLDDPTAAIDSETEHEIFEALDRAIAVARPSSWRIGSAHSGAQILSLS